MAKFYDNENDGKVHLRLPSGGSGGGQTSYVDRVATKQDFNDFPLDHGEYLAARKSGEPVRFHEPVAEPGAAAVEPAATETTAATATAPAVPGPTAAKTPKAKRATSKAKAAPKPAAKSKGKR